MSANPEYGGADVTGADPDLIYNGRRVKRPPGASEETQEIYRLLHEHPDGMTVDEIHDELRDGWMATDVYRAYAHSLEADRARRARQSAAEQVAGARRRTQKPREPVQYGTPAFQEAAQRRSIASVLSSMRRNGTARSEGAGAAARWFAARPPRVPGARRTYVLFDPVKSREVLTSTTREHVDRELVKADLLEVLRDKRVKGKTRDLVQSAYDRLCGRY